MSDIFLSLNRYGVLKVPFSLWLIVVLQAWHWVLFVLVVFSVPISRDIVNLVPDDFSWVHLVREAPILLLVVAVVGRHPAGGSLVRQLWRRGREIITLSVLANVAWVIWFLWGVDYWQPWPERAVLTFGLIHLVILVVTWSSGYYRQLFSEFPEAG